MVDEHIFGGGDLVVLIREKRNEFIELCKEITESENISETEAKRLFNWFEDNAVVKTQSPMDGIYPRLAEMLSEETLSETDAHELHGLLKYCIEIFEKIEKYYLELVELIHNLFHPLAFCYECNLEKEEDAHVCIENITSDKKLRDKILTKSLKIININKIKHIDINNIDYKKLFIKNIHQIIKSLCNDKDYYGVEYYKYNIYAFYIIFSELSEKTYRVKRFTDNQLYFYHGLYKDVKSLNFLFFDSYRKNKFRKGNFIKNLDGQRDRIDIILGITNILYSGTAMDAPSTDQHNMAIFIMRGFIENWFRNNFDLCINDNSHLQISLILSIIKKHLYIRDRKTKVSPLKDIDNHIESLSNIIQWSNIYVHTERSPLFWMPYIVFKYLKYVKDECTIGYSEDTGTTTLYPPLIYKDSDVYKKICEEIQKIQIDNKKYKVKKCCFSNVPCAGWLVRCGWLGRLMPWMRGLWRPSVRRCVHRESYTPIPAGRRFTAERRWW